MSEIPILGRTVMLMKALKEATDSFLMSIPPKERLKAKRLIYGFIEKAAASVPPATS